MSQALVSGAVLRWARERAGASVDAVAQKLKVSASEVESWEKETGRPTFAKARDMANFLRVPFGYLFLDKPPRESALIPDLRRLGDKDAKPLSLEFYQVYRDAIAKQNWYREYLSYNGAEPLVFVGSKFINDDAKQVAADMRSILGVTASWREECASWEEMFRELITKTEDAGILVLRNSVVGHNTKRPLSVQEFRGFALSDPLAPLVFINSGDALSAQIFSLAHELAHIWLNISGISNFVPSQASSMYDPIEVFCNKVAGEFLVDHSDFLSVWQPEAGLDKNAKNLSKKFRVSRFVIARRALDTGKVTQKEYNDFVEQELKYTSGTKDTKKKGGPDFFTLACMRNSPKFSRALLREVLEGRVLFRDAGQLLSIKPAMLKELAKKLDV